MESGTALLIGSIISAATSVGTAEVERKSLSKSDAAADLRSKKTIAAKKALADKTKAAVAKKGGNVELRSSESLEDEKIKRRSARSRLRIERRGDTSSVGTGLRVG